MKRRFRVELVRVVTLEIDSELLRDVDTDEWRKELYNLRGADEFAGHIAFNLDRGVPLDLMDGFADQDPGRVRVLSTEDDIDVKEMKT